jgi:polyribonucleotide nucleotidyltransferase
LAEAFGKKETREFEVGESNDELAEKIHNAAYQKCYDIAKKGTSKNERSLAFAEVTEEIIASFTEEEIDEFGSMIGPYFNKAQKEAVRELTLSEGLRL